MKHRKKYMSEFKEQWRLVTNVRNQASKEDNGGFSKGFVNLIRFYLRSKSQKHIRNVIYLGIMDWEVLILLGKLLGYEVKLPSDFKKNDIINKVLLLDLKPITLEEK